MHAQKDLAAQAERTSEILFRQTVCCSEQPTGFETIWPEILQFYGSSASQLSPNNLPFILRPQ